MNIYTQVCGLIIVVILLIFWKRLPTMGLESEKRFLHCLYSVIACVSLDILSVIVITYQYQLSSKLVEIIAKAYLVSLVLVSFTTLLYTCSDMYQKYPDKLHRIHSRMYKILLVVGVSAIIFLPIDYYTDGTYLYSTGYSPLATYIICLTYIVAVLTETIYHKNLIKARRRHAVMFWMFLWIFAAVLQFIFPKLLIVGFASCIGIMVTFFEMENPKANISRRSGHFSSSVIRDYFDFLYSKKEHFSVMMVTFATTADSSQDSELLRRTIDELTEFLYTITNAKIFSTAEGYFMLVFSSSDFMESTKYQINQHFKQVELNPDTACAITLLSPFYIQVPDAGITENSDELLALIADFTPSDLKNIRIREITIDNNSIQALREKRRIEDMIVDAMVSDRIEVFYQPIYSIHEKSFTSAEALVRIRLKNGTLISPSEFIPIAEDTGRIIPLSDAIMKKAFSFMSSYHLERLGVKYIELNLSIKQGEDNLFPSKMNDLLETYKLDPSFINLEITETASLSRKEAMLNNMNKLTKLGLQFSLDDFGSGSSNLNYIIDMPVNAIKFDMELTDAYFHNPKARAVVTAVTEMAHSMDLKIVAEGIETEEQYKVMEDIGIDYIQGYYFSKPLPEHDYLKFIQNNNLKIKQHEA